MIRLCDFIYKIYLMMKEFKTVIKNFKAIFKLE